MTKEKLYLCSSALREVIDRARWERPTEDRCASEDDQGEQHRSFSSKSRQPFVIGGIQTPIGGVPQVSTRLALRDHWGTLKARWGVGRMRYTVQPGLYAVGCPDEHSAVMVTANYKMSLDCLRSALPGRDVWIVVLNTGGINVWCAAGKGTFGTDELINRIESTAITRVISHRRLIVPQLGASGVAAHQVKRRSGFEVVYGPIRAKDLPAFMDGGLKTTPEMRRKTFDLLDRVVLIPIELVGALKWGVPLAACMFFLAGLRGSGGFWSSAFSVGGFAAEAVLTAIFSGAVLTPLLLPWLPGRSFSVKGLIAGVLAVAFLLLQGPGGLSTWPGRFEVLAWILLVPSISAYLAMNFTGASTYTSLSGVRREMRWALPLQIAGGVGGFGFWMSSHLIA